jgi:hypothetical protein
MLRLPLVPLLLGVALLLTSPQVSASPEDAYVVEDIKLPKGIAPEIGGLAFNSKGELIVVTRRSGILIGKPTTDPTAFEWRVFSDNSLHEALGVLVEDDDRILVPQFPELTRIADTDHDGKADLYETVSDGWGVSGNYHESVQGPLSDGLGNWFLNIGTASFNGVTFDRTRGKYSPVGRRGRNFSAVQWRGWVVKVTPDGQIIPWASGFRANNGMCLGPDGSLWVTDNQGDFRPTSPLYHIEKGKFYGHASSLIWDPEFTRQDPLRDPLKEPIASLNAMRTEASVLFPHGLMINSPAQPVFDRTDGRFGPFTGQMFVPDAAGQRVLRVMLEKVDGAWQGACTPLFKDNGLRAGNNRLAFSPDNKALYVGQTMRGWAVPNEGLQRIIYTGKPLFAVRDMHLLPDGFELVFTEPADRTLATAIDRFHVQSYYYPYSQDYGASQADRKSVTPTGVTLSADGCSVRIVLGALTPARIYQLDLVGLISAAGHPLAYPMVCYTLNRLAR